MIVEKGSIKYGDENDRLPADGMSADAGSGDRSERRFLFHRKDRLSDFSRLSGGGCSGESGKTGGRMEGISDTGRAGFFHDRRSLKAFRDSGRRKNRDFCGLDL